MKMLQILVSLVLIAGKVHCVEQNQNKVNIAGLEKSEVLRALFNVAQPLGMGYLHYNPKALSKSEAEKILMRTCQFDYLEGRVMKVNICGESFNSSLFNRDNGEEAAEKAIQGLRERYKK